MKQLTLATVGFERYARTTRRVAFLAEMEWVVPWPALCTLVDPYYPKPGNGRPPVGVERMLRIYFLQHGSTCRTRRWRRRSTIRWPCAVLSASISAREPVPDETTVCRFRHLLEAHDLGRPLFDEVQRTSPPRD
jgi:IS5 family transposase